MRHQDEQLLAEMRARALATEKRRKSIKGERRELETTIDALSELTGLDRGELERMSSSIRHEMRARERSRHRRPTLIGSMAVLTMAAALLYWGNPLVAGWGPAPAESPTTHARRSPDPAANRGPAVRPGIRIVPSPTTGFNVNTMRLLEAQRERTQCTFDGLVLPEDAVVYAAGGYRGRRLDQQIDQSGHDATRIDVAVNSPARPVVLMLGAYEPTIWSVGWTRGTEILAVLVSGYYRQAVAGLAGDVPVLNSSGHNKGPCERFYVSTSNENLVRLNPISRRLFGREVELVYLAKDGTIVVGEPVGSAASLLTSTATTPESFIDENAPLAGQAGLDDAVRKGLIRPATPVDAQAWADAVGERDAQLNEQLNLPPVAGDDAPRRTNSPQLFRAYVVLEPFRYPAGLGGANAATFFIAKGVPLPTGDPGHSAVYDFNSTACIGALCNLR